MPIKKSWLPRSKVVVLAGLLCLPTVASAETFVCALKPIGNKYADFVPTALEVSVQADKGIASVRHSGSYLGEQDRIFAKILANSQSRLSVVWNALQKHSYSGQMNSAHKISLDKVGGEARFSVDLKFRGTGKARGTCRLKGGFVVRLDCIGLHHRLRAS